MIKGNDEKKSFKVSLPLKTSRIPYFKKDGKELNIDVKKES